MRKWFFIFVFFPLAAMAGESGWGNFLGKFFPRTTANVNSTVDAVTAPADGSYLQNTITERFAPAQVQQQGYPAAMSAAPYQAAPTQIGVQPTTSATTHDQSVRENLVRCMYAGKLIETNTALSEESVEAQTKAERVGKLYASLKCNEVLNGYAHVISGVDQAVGQCLDNEDCQTIKLSPTNSSGNIKK
ncbi:MAG: hypothetical protein IT286_00815 [Proteobacteria bacterium]|jgi:hypothetical protein|nr:hypothetical protein [Pseudomonadota bacterium]